MHARQTAIAAAAWESLLAALPCRKLWLMEGKKGAVPPNSRRSC